MRKLLNALLAALLLAGLGAPALANDLANSSWSETDTSNNATPPNGWPSATMLPNQVEPAARAMMGALKRDWDQNHPTITAGGTANAITLTYAVAPAAYVQGERFTFIAGASANTGATTLNVNGLGAVAITKRGTTALVGGEIKAGELVSVAYDGAEFQLETVGAAANTVPGGSSGNIQYNNGASAFAGLALAAHQIPEGATPSAVTIVDCQDTTGNHLNYTQSTDTFSCGTTVGTAAVHSITRQTFTTSGTYTPHAGMLYCLVRLQAPGGGSGGTAATTTSNMAASGGGGSGGYAERVLTAAQIGASQTVTIGAVGTAGTNAPGAGGQGGTTSLGALLSATGGLGGAAGSAGTTPTSSAGGAGGVGSSGDLNVNGNAGSPGWIDGATSQTMAYGGAGAPSPAFGGGVAGPFVAIGAFAAGTAGSNYGAGASGNGSNVVSHAAAVGLAGAPGIIDIIEFNSQ